MPTYPYLCKDCGHSFEVVQSFTDDALTTCPKCSGALRKVFSSVGIVFKGSGFYATDSRGSRSNGTPAKTSQNGSANGSKSAPNSAGSETGNASSGSDSSASSSAKPASTSTSTTSA